MLYDSTPPHLVPQRSLFGTLDGQGMNRRLKYDPLYVYLAQQEPGSEHLRLTFQQIEGILGESLPPSAYNHSSWWGNRPNARHMSLLTPPLGMKQVGG